MSEPAFNIDGLSPEERLNLIEHLWDSLGDDDVPLTAAQRDELDRRLDDMERGEVTGIPWEDVLKRLRKRFQ